MKSRWIKGQSILEYTLVLAAVIAVIVYVLIGAGDNSIKKKIQSSYEKAGEAIDTTTSDLSGGVFQGTGTTGGS